MNPKSNITVWLTVCVFWATLPSIAAGRTVYVDTGAAGLNNGSSWVNAYMFLQDALTEAREFPGEVTEILVAEGTYFPDQDNGNPGGSGLRTASFDMVNGTSIYGGYPTGGGTRDHIANQTILSGDLLEDDDLIHNANYGENSYHVVTSSGIMTEVIIFGLIIRSGNADGPADEDKSGGGIYSSNSILTMVRCRVEISMAQERAGGMYNEGGEQTLVNCRFFRNHTVDGGGIYNENCSQTLINCLFNLNSAFTGYGGGVCCATSVDLTMVNCTLADNWADGDGSGVAATALQEQDKNFIRIHNCILWNYNAVNQIGNTNNISEIIVTYSDVQTLAGGVYPGGHNINQHPIFSTDFTLHSSSPCIDAGNNDEILPDVVDLDEDTYSQEQTPFDLGELVRRMDRPATEDEGNGEAPVVDMGAHEFPWLAVIYVDTYGTGNGSSWQDACSVLIEAINCAIPPAIIYVAKGYYSADQSGSGGPGETFQMSDNLKIFGGFCGLMGGGSNPDERDFEKYETVLSGWRNGPSCYHVVTGSGTDWSAVLDGFTITQGNASGAADAERKGGGMYNDAGSPTVRNCKFFDNNAASDGGGMYNGNNSNPKVTNCLFLENSANSGGGMANRASSPTITNCRFMGNTANGGGAIRNNNGSSPIITNCVFSGNSSNSGGGINSSNSTEVLTNCTFSHNSASGSGGGLFAQTCISTVNNSIFRNNTAQFGPQIAVVSGGVLDVNYCDLQGGADDIYRSGNPLPTVNAAHIMDQDPLFIDPDGDDDVYGTEDDNVRLGDDSPCIDAADNTLVPVDTPDLDGDKNIVELIPLDCAMYPRFMDPLPIGGSGNPLPPDYVDIVDMGAYEYLEFDVIYVDSSAAGEEDGTSWEDAYTHLQDAFAREALSVRIYVAQGTYRPDEYAGDDTDEQNETFRLRPYMRMYGGYAGTQGADPDERDIAAYETILSGLVATDPNRSCFHVVTASDTDRTTIFDGFTVTLGDANGPAPEDKYGGGMYCKKGNPAITSCTFLQNRAESEGGGIYFYDSGPTVTKCAFIQNWAGDTGGGMSNSSFSYMTMTDCNFIENSSDAGGGLTNTNNESTITNCLFQGNTADTNGGAMVSNITGGVLTGCTFNGNLAGRTAEQCTRSPKARLWSDARLRATRPTKAALSMAITLGPR